MPPTIKSRAGKYDNLGRGRHNTDTELGFRRGFKSGYAAGWSDRKHGRTYDDNPETSDDFVYDKGSKK